MLSVRGLQVRNTSLLPYSCTLGIHVQILPSIVTHCYRIIAVEKAQKMAATMVSVYVLLQ